MRPPAESLITLATDLDAALERTAAALHTLCAHLVGLRQAVALDDLALLLETSDDVEQSEAQIARLEQERLQIQRALEQALGVTGLPAVIVACQAVGPLGKSLSARHAAIGTLVRELQTEGQRASQLLTAGAELAKRTRAYVARLRGLDPPYRAPATSGGRP